MARAAKPERQDAPASPAEGDNGLVTDIDAREFEQAKRDPRVKEFARYADEVLRSLRRRKPRR